MTEFLTGLAVGLMLGGTIGVVIMSVLFASRRDIPIFPQRTRGASKTGTAYSPNDNPNS